MRNTVILHQITLPTVGLLSVLFLSACGDQPVRVSRPIEKNEPIATDAIAVTTTPSGQLSEALNLTAEQLQRGELVPAAASIEMLKHTSLSPDELGYLRRLEISLLYRQGEVLAATALVDQSLIELSAVASDQYWPLLQWHLQLLRNRGRHLQNARESTALLQQIETAGQREFLRNLIWQGLQNTSVEKLEGELTRANSDEWRGWLELALLKTRDKVDPAIQQAAWRAWKNNYSGHPAALNPPPGTDDTPTRVPASVALLLPLSGNLAPAGQAVADGYIAAMYNSVRQGWPEHTIHVLDINEYSDVNAAYTQASSLAVDLIVGPLTRSALQKWQRQATPATPVLALNRLELEYSSAQPLYQLALAPEDEASQLADWAYAKGARNALIIRPESSFGATMSNSFSQTWRRQSGRIAAEAIYTDQSNYSSSIKEALELASSEARAAKIRQLINVRVEFTPRRRQDIDSVFILTSKPQEARSLKPLVAFYYAGELPIYATSYIFSGQTNPQQNRDLNGAQLLEIPWLLSADNPEREELRKANYQDNLAAMYALGADAFSVHWRLPQLKANSGQSVRGQTGLLGMDSQGKIYRTLQPALIRNGVAIPSEG